jgi:hypothetical protein
MECIAVQNSDACTSCDNEDNSKYHKSNTMSMLNLTKTKAGDGDDETSVRVALRIRPQLSRERLEMCKICTYVTPNEPQVTLGTDKSFTFDYMFDISSQQGDVFNECIKNLIDCTLNGYNATVLAYGQTGSGKTFTMGTSFDINLLPDEEGIVPRAVQYMFQQIDEKTKSTSNTDYAQIKFTVYAQFMELYNEEIIDLFDTTINQPRDSASMPSPSSSSSLPANNNSFVIDAPSTAHIRTNRQKIEIHEDLNNNVYVSGCTMRTVASVDEVRIQLRFFLPFWFKF